MSMCLLYGLISPASAGSTADEPGVLLKSPTQRLHRGWCFRFTLCRTTPSMCFWDVMVIIDSSALFPGCWSGA